MTLARLIETGSGKLAVRVEIEGLAVQFVSDPFMERTDADGRRRVYCFCTHGQGASKVTIEESVNLPDAVLEASPAQLRLHETQDEDLSDAFHHAPTLMQWLSAKVADDATTIPLLGTTGITAGDVVHIGTEAILVGSVSATELTGCTRGYWGTIARDIWTLEPDAGSTTRAVLTDRPLSVRGRRVRIYLYGDGDDLQGDGGNGGDPVWRGLMASDPRWDEAGTSVNLAIGPLVKLFETKLGGELGPANRPRGIYYSWAAPLSVIMLEDSSAGFKDPGVLRFTGHYETQVDFIEALNTAITAHNAGVFTAGVSFAAVSTDSGRWTIHATAGSATTALQVTVKSHQDGETANHFDAMLDVETGELAPAGSLSLGDRVEPKWTVGPPGARTVPRGVFGVPETSEIGTVGSDAATWPHNRVYLARPATADWSAIVASWPPPTDASQQHPVGSLDLANNSVDLLRAPGTGGPSGGAQWAVYTATQQAELRPVRDLVAGGIGDLRDALVAESIAYADRGTAPFVTEEDLASWSTVGGAAERFAWQRTRYLQLFAAADLDEVLAAELRLRGLYPITDSTGKIALAQIQVPNTSQSATTTIDEEIISAGWSSMARGSQKINRWHLKTGYDPIEDEWASFVEAFDSTSYAQDHQDRTLDIEPRSFSDVGDETIDAEQAADAALPVLALFGYPHDFVSVNVSWKLFEVRLGDVVTFSADHLPGYSTGRRPMSQIAAVVTGRRWTLGEAHGTLTLLCSWANVAGYSPSVEITGESDNGSDNWTLVCAGTAYPAGTDHRDWWAAGDRVRIRKRDSETADAINGTVTVVSEVSLRVTFDSTWTPGAFSWGLGFAKYTDADTTAGQQAFAALAGDDAVLGASDLARTYGA